MINKTFKFFIIVFVSIGFIFFHYKVSLFFNKMSEGDLIERKKKFNVLIKKNNIIMESILDNLHEKDPIIMSMFNDKLIIKEISTK